MNKLIPLCLFLMMMFRVLAQERDQKISDIHFHGKSTRLDRKARAALDSLVLMMSADTTFKIRVLGGTLFEDPSGLMGARVWDRNSAISNYLSRRGIAAERVMFLFNSGGNERLFTVYLMAP